MIFHYFLSFFRISNFFYEFQTLVFEFQTLVFDYSLVFSKFISWISNFNL